MITYVTLNILQQQQQHSLLLQLLLLVVVVIVVVVVVAALQHINGTNLKRNTFQENHESREAEGRR